MKYSKSVEWNKLDNASKYFPATANELDTKVFRLSCELYEMIDPNILQKALNKTIESFPFFKSILRRGVFWYYFESSDLIPEVSEESLSICAPIYNKNTKNLLFRVFYYHKRITLFPYTTLFRSIKIRKTSCFAYFIIISELALKSFMLFLMEKALCSFYRP